MGLGKKMQTLAKNTIDFSMYNYSHSRTKSLSKPPVRLFLQRTMSSDIPRLWLQKKIRGWRLYNHRQFYLHLTVNPSCKVISVMFFWELLMMGTVVNTLTARGVNLWTHLTVQTCQRHHNETKRDVITETFSVHKCQYPLQTDVMNFHRRLLNTTGY